MSMCSSLELLNAGPARDCHGNRVTNRSLFSQTRTQVFSFEVSKLTTSSLATCSPYNTTFIMILNTIYIQWIRRIVSFIK